MGKKERKCSKGNPNFTLSLNDKVFDGLSSFKVETVVSFFFFNYHHFPALFHPWHEQTSSWFHTMWEIKDLLWLNQTVDSHIEVWDAVQLCGKCGIY